jgi:hypothetical protein
MRFGILKYAFTLFAANCVVAGFAQQSNQFISRDYNINVERIATRHGSNMHTGVQPYLTSDLQKELHPDSVRGTSLINASNRLFLKPKIEKREFRVRVFPMVTMSSGIDITDTITRGTYEMGGGLGIGGDIGKKFSFYADGLVQQGQYPTYLEDYMRQNEVNPGMGYARFGNEGVSSFTYNGYLSYAPLEPINLQLGVGKNFWGDGYRSLFLSDQAMSYPYLKITTTIWNIKYVNLFTAMYDITGASGDYSRSALKYTTMHYLSYNISKRINISLWEAVVWQNRDNENFRGYDINYLNPIIFYRPVEFKQGSSDNSIIGLNASVKIGKGTQIYGQIMLDEFLLDSIRSGNGWYANKQGMQLGVKSYDLLKIEGLSGRAEFNWVRPFSYTHGSPKQNHAHFNEPLAHTLGTNFYDGIISMNYRKKRYSFNMLLIYGLYGRDPDDKNLGGNIYRSDNEQPRPVSGNYTGQGIHHQVYSQNIRAAYIIDPHLGLQVEVGYLYRHKVVDGSTSNTHFFQIGIRTALWNLNRDF